jgi:hypothetical protein
MKTLRVLDSSGDREIAFDDSDATALARQEARALFESFHDEMTGKSACVLGLAGPFQTVARGITAASGGDIVLIRSGHYNETQVRREFEAILADPNSSEEDRQFVRRMLMEG